MMMVECGVEKKNWTRMEEGNAKSLNNEMRRNIEQRESNWSKKRMYKNYKLIFDYCYTFIMQF